MREFIDKFLNSDLSEADYYQVSKDNLIYLKDYLLLLKLKDSDYQNLIQKPVESIKKKCAWFKEVGFDGIQQNESNSFVQTGLQLFANDNNNVFARSKNGEYVGLINEKELPKVYLIAKTVRTAINRQNDFKLIQSELQEIDEIGKMIYSGYLYPKKSVSERFTIYFTPVIGISTWYGEELLANFYERNFKSYNKPYIKGEDKKKLLTKIQINKYN